LLILFVYLGEKKNMANERILVVDDEEDILELVRYNLAKEGYRVTSALTGEDALNKARSETFDLIVLDLMLPGIDGLEVAKRLKKSPKTEQVPIVMLSAKGEEADIVTGLELGADDYITKPFSPRIMLARVRTALRRKTGKPKDETAVIHIFELEIHPGRRSVLAFGKPVDLTFTEFQVLYLLARRPGWVFTRSMIVDAVHGDDYPVTDRSVDVQIVGLRKKLGDCGKYIETVRGVGYRMKENP
jgi:two-component system alkaline phosphatase synthesis response regulator PhoP